MSRLVLSLGVLIIFISFFLSITRLLNCLVVVENLNVLLLLVMLSSQWGETTVLFLALVVMFTVEVVLALTVLVRLWDSGSLIDVVGI